jgi:transcriptional regulator with XRE-family HTH domain
MATEDTQTGEEDLREKTAGEMGKRIGQARREAGFRTAQDFSEAIDVSVWTVRSWESGKSQPRYHMLKTISQLLGRPQGWFLGEGAIHDRLDRAMGDLLARRKVHEERDGEEAGVYGIPVVDQASEEELQALSSDARDWGILIRLTSPIPPASASEVAALHLALANLMARDEFTQ